METLKKADELLKVAADVFRVKYPENDLALLKEKVEECLQIIDPKNDEELDEEHYDNLKDLNELLGIAADNDPERMKLKLLEFIGGQSWDNFIDDETKQPYSLGSMYFNKLQWACEHYSFIHDYVVEILGNMLETVPPYLDQLEIFANSK